MDPKLTLLFLLIGTIVGLSHLSDDSLSRMRRQLIDRRWRDFVHGRRKILGGRRRWRLFLRKSQRLPAA